jgi:hypothetical protein
MNLSSDFGVKSKILFWKQKMLLEIRVVWRGRENEVWKESEKKLG